MENIFKRKQHQINFFFSLLLFSLHLQGSEIIQMKQRKTHFRWNCSWCRHADCADLAVQAIDSTYLDFQWATSLCSHTAYIWMHRRSKPQVQVSLNKICGVAAAQEVEWSLGKMLNPKLFHQCVHVLRWAAGTLHDYLNYQCMWVLMGWVVAVTRKALYTCSQLVQL